MKGLSLFERTLATMSTVIKGWISGTPLAPPAKFALRSARKISEPIENAHFLLKNKHRLEGKKTIFYTITPPDRLDNIGDHAQAVGIKKWFSEYFPEYQVMELDKDQTSKYVSSLRTLVGDDDLIFLHSGGNLNDRSLWSEGARREVVNNLDQNPIIQLPQTVFFSESEEGRRELENSKRVYNSHEDLTIVARDPVSHDHVQDFFSVKNDVCPDFALMLDAEDFIRPEGKRSGVMLCLRRDQESDISAMEKEKLVEFVQDANFQATQFDTTLDEPIPKDQREAFLADTLSKFAEHELVITDRFHGMIFSVITRTPCIAIDTVDHKISSSSEWFSMYEGKVKYVSDIDNISYIIEETAAEELDVFDWEGEFFSELAGNIRKSHIL